jgi:esterase/lipase superfamily enzyme
MRHSRLAALALPFFLLTAGATRAQVPGSAGAHLAASTGASTPRPAAGVLADGGLLCVSDPLASRRLHEQPIRVETVTGDTFAVTDDGVLPLEMLYPGDRNYIRSRPWFAGPTLDFLGRSYTKVGDPAPEPIRAMHPAGTVGDFWLFRKDGADPRNDVYAITAPGCEFQHYQSTAPPVRGMRPSLSLRPRHHDIGFATNRGPTDDPHPEHHFGTDQTTLSYGTAVLTVPQRHTPGGAEFNFLYGRDTLRNLVLARLGPAVPPSSGRKALVFVHGYYNSFEDAARRTAQLADDLDFDGDVYFFSWPSLDTFIGYTVDEGTVQRSRPDFKAVLDALLREYGDGNVSVIAHSLGNRGFAQAVRDLQPGHAPKMFETVVLASADQGLVVFTRDDIGPILQASNHVTAYASTRDAALAASARLDGGPRAGNDPASLASIAGLEVVDTSPESCGMAGHSDYAECEVVLGDLFLLFRGRTPQQRHLIQVPTDRGTYWRVP